jgi:glycerate kinase
MSIEEEMSKIRVLGAFDKFKDTLGAEEVTKSVFRGLEKVFPNRIQTTAVTLR